MIRGLPGSFRAVDEEGVAGIEATDRGRGLVDCDAERLAGLRHSADSVSTRIDGVIDVDRVVRRNGGRACGCIREQS